MSDLESATGVTKGALYGNFNGKDEIAAEAFKYAMKKVRACVQQKLSQASTYKSQLIALFDFYGEYVFTPPVSGGCPLLNSAVEVDDDHPTMRRVVVKELVQTIQFIAGLIDKGIEGGEFKKDTNSMSMAYIFFCSIEGALMFARAERSREPMDIILKHCRKQLDLISKS
jgi:TetR/AcrR family transcriptional repressor of nem operon